MKRMLAGVIVAVAVFAIALRLDNVTLLTLGGLLLGVGLVVGALVSMARRDRPGRSSID